MIEKLIEYIRLQIKSLEKDLESEQSVLWSYHTILRLNTQRKTLQHILDKIQKLQDEHTQ